MSQVPALTSHQELLNIAREAAQISSSLLMRAIQNSFEVETKGSLGDVVTEVDIAAERAIRDFLLTKRPYDHVVGEEFPETSGENPEFRWSIDPIDGTSNFVKSLPHFGPSIGVQEVATGIWIVGVVHAPVLDKEYFAVRGQGAWLTHAESTTRISGPDPDSQTRLFGTGFSYDPKSRAQQYAALPELMKKFTDLRSVGSAALGLCLAAEGAVDAFVESDLYEFDWAAGALIAEEAGLIVTRPKTFRGGIYAYPKHLLPEQQNS